MNAAEARKLKVGDWVIALFGGRGVSKKCEIIEINWPRFRLRTKDHKGDEMIRTRNYKSLYGTTSGDVPSVRPPSWLKLPENWEDVK